MALDSREFEYPLPDRSVDVVFYHKVLKDKITTHQSPNDLLHKYKIVNVAHYKRKSSVQHELLVATAVNDNALELFFRIERTSDKTKVPAFPGVEKRTNIDEDMRLVLKAFDEDIAELSSTKIQVSHGRVARGDFTITSDSLSDSILDSSPTTAQDLIKLVEKFEPSTRWAEVDNVKPRALYLYHLSIITMVVHTRDPIYTLMRHQCYWFAAMIMGTIRQWEQDADSHFPLQCNPVKHAEVLMKISIAKTLNSKYLSGTFYKIPIVRAYPVMVYRLWLNAQAEVTSWHEKIDKKVKRDMERQEASQRAQQEIADQLKASQQDKHDLRRKLGETEALVEHLNREITYLRGEN